MTNEQKAERREIRKEIKSANSEIQDLEDMSRVTRTQETYDRILFLEQYIDFKEDQYKDVLSA